MSTEPTPTDKKKSPLSSPHAWVSSTYFAEGYPYAIVHTLAEVLFKEMGASLQAIGLTSLFHLPWNLKFLWGPFLDGYGTKRAWLVWTEIIISAIVLFLAFSNQMGQVLTVASILFMILALVSATHDIAIDGYYLEGLDSDGQSKYVGYRSAAYRIGAWMVSGPLLIIIGQQGWTLGLLAAAGIMGLILLYHWMFLPKVEVARAPLSQLVASLMKMRSMLITLIGVAIIFALRTAWNLEVANNARAQFFEAVPALAKVSTSGWIAIILLSSLSIMLLNLGRIKRRLESKDSLYFKAFVDFLEQPKVGLILSFVILFRTGESFLLKMRYAFLRDIGLSIEQVGIASGTVGLACLTVSTLLGGYLISRDGLKRWLWPFVISQNVLNLMYMGLAFYHDQQVLAGGSAGIVPATIVIAIESIGSGLGTAVFMVYIMRCCRPQFKAAHMAILTALMSLSFTIAGVVSGFLASALGYGWYFALTFLATWPAMALMAYVPYLDGTSAADLDSAPSPTPQP